MQKDRPGPSVESVRRFSATMSIHRNLRFLTTSGDWALIRKISSPIRTKFRLKAGSGPLVDGSLISEITGLEGGKRLGRLKDWLHRIQVERDLASEEK